MIDIIYFEYFCSVLCYVDVNLWSLSHGVIHLQMCCAEL